MVGIGESGNGEVSLGVTVIVAVGVGVIVAFSVVEGIGVSFGGPPTIQLVVAHS